MNYIGEYEFVVKEHTIQEIVDNSIAERRVVSIGLCDKNKGITVPHPLTDFILCRYEYRGVSINTTKAPAYVVCRFLNYILKRITEGDSDFKNLINTGISGLTLKHGSLYLTNLTESGLKRDTVLYYENYLKEFYLYLQEKSLLNQNINFQYSQNNKGDCFSISPFKSINLETRYPPRAHNNNKLVKLKDFGVNRNKLVIEFLEESKEVAPKISFALCLQFFGGLRRGEIVNVTRSDLDIKFRKSLSVKIRDNRPKLFTHLKDSSAEKPKRLNYLEPHLAKQIILNSDLLWDYYEAHMKDLDIKLQDNYLKNPYIMFYDKTGKAMSGRVFEKRFKKVKKSFLKKLAMTVGREEDYYLLKDSYWSTHIGRGIFTSFLADMGLSVLQIAIARGDTNINSVLDYIDRTTTIQKIVELQNELLHVPKEEFGNIDQSTLNDQWINKEAFKDGRRFR